MAVRFRKLKEPKEASELSAIERAQLSRPNQVLSGVMVTANPERRTTGAKSRGGEHSQQSSPQWRTNGPTDSALAALASCATPGVNGNQTPDRTYFGLLRRIDARSRRLRGRHRCWLPSNAIERIGRGRGAHG